MAQDMVSLQSGYEGFVIDFLFSEVSYSVHTVTPAKKYQKYAWVFHVCGEALGTAAMCNTPHASVDLRCVLDSCPMQPQWSGCNVFETGISKVTTLSCHTQNPMPAAVRDSPLLQRTAVAFIERKGAC